ncbi:uncharacterized protein C20orf96 homolog isoform X3 [Accipiter gentilis]|uniref:uncharacterized protein C20orf96 homolog isoform X3 n=2 Tax=Astur gentilis TaxID=8957 RepID=UPI00210FDE52|nr:uncharacterized protein C20orf96 homolog isoform X3 [Accipiter gentilis]
METGPGDGDAGACAEMDGQGPGPNITEEFKRIDYSKWQKAEAEERKSPAHRLTLPLLTSEDKKKKGEKNKPVAFMLSKKTPLPSETSSSQEKYRSFTQRKLALKKAELAKTLEEIKITTNLTNLKKNAVEELKQRSAHLAETNCRLMKGIQHTDDSTAKQARSLLQRYEVLQRVKAIVQTFNQNRLDTARAELQETEKTMEKNLGKLQQQLDEVTSKVQVLQDELSVLRTYIDGQYPEQAVQIALLQRSIQKLKEQQQEEIGKTEEMGKAILEELEEKARAEQEALLQKVVEETLLHQDGLKQMVINNHILRCEILRQREMHARYRGGPQPPCQGDAAHLTLGQAPLAGPSPSTRCGRAWMRCQAAKPPPLPSALLRPSPAQPPWGLADVVFMVQ